MNDFTISPGLTPERARAAATTYGWGVLPHDHGGFLAECGRHRLVVTFAPDGSFQTADIREGFGGESEPLSETDVIGTLARYGSPVRPDEEQA